MQYLFFSCIAASSSRLVVEHMHPAQTCPARRCRWMVWLFFCTHGPWHFRTRSFGSIICLHYQNEFLFTWMEIGERWSEGTQKHHQLSSFFFKEWCLIVFAAAWNLQSQVIPSMLSLTWPISKVFASPWAFNMFGTLILGMMLSCLIVSGWFRSIWVSGRIGKWNAGGFYWPIGAWTKDKAHADLEAKIRTEARCGVGCCWLVFTGFFLQLELQYRLHKVMIIILFSDVHLNIVFLGGSSSWTKGGTYCMLYMFQLLTMSPWAASHCFFVLGFSTMREALPDAEDKSKKSAWFSSCILA